MDCSNCFLAFQHQFNLPRILISCGHSVCTECVIEITLNGDLACPDCQAPWEDNKEAIENQELFNRLFPVNVALLNLIKTT